MALQQMVQVIRQAVQENNLRLLKHIEQQHLTMSEELTPMGTRIVSATDSEVKLNIPWKDCGIATVSVKPSFAGQKIKVTGLKAEDRKELADMISRPLNRMVSVAGNGERLI